jgi:hypothetical protein
MNQKHAEETFRVVGRQHHWCSQAQSFTTVTILLEILRDNRYDVLHAVRFLQTTYDNNKQMRAALYTSWALCYCQNRHVAGYRTLPGFLRPPFCSHVFRRSRTNRNATLITSSLFNARIGAACFILHLVVTNGDTNEVSKRRVVAGQHCFDLQHHNHAFDLQNYYPSHPML